MYPVIRTQYYTDVKSQIFAGMEFTYKKGGTKSAKMREVGYDIVRLYYDTPDKDLLVWQERIKRVMK